MELLTILLILIFLVGLAIAYWLGTRAGSFKRDRYWEEQLPDYKKEAIMKSRAVIGGQFSEQLAPYLPNFPFLPTECKFVGKPVDFLVFKGMDGKEINEIVFVEMKSGNSKLSPQEKNLKEVVEKRNIRWMEYRIPEELTKKGNIEEKLEGIVDEKIKRKR
ncbi:MAG: Holliday junction resolvase-like protein [Nanobdellota archaeon]